jgi:DNA primase
MSEIYEFANSHIYPAVFEIADKIFPEFEFKRKGNHWVSNNGRKIDGSDGEKNKVYLYFDRPHYIKDYTRDGIVITDYLISQNKLSSWIEAIRYLAHQVNVQLPDRHLNEEDIERIKKREHQSHLFETINDFFIHNLLEENGRSGDEIRKYLSNRGYANHLFATHDEIHSSDKMELGFFPSRDKLKKHLKSKSVEEEIINNLFIAGGSFYLDNYGTTHQLTIPYRDHTGRIKGFVLRNIHHKKGDKPEKYLCSTGLSRKDTLFKLSPLKNTKKELTVVEGYLDVMFLKAHGIEDVTALGGVSLNTEQVVLAKKFGTELITLWLDNDEAGISSTDRAIEVINKSNIGIKTYVVEIPDSYSAKDPDELIRSYGINAYSEIVKYARPWYIYRANKILNQVENLPTDKDRDHLLNKINKLGKDLHDPIDREIYCQHIIEKGSVHGVSPETLKKAMEKLSYEAEKEKKTAEIKKGFDKARSYLEEGREDDAINIINNISQKRNAELSRSSYEELFKPITQEDVRSSIEKQAGAFDTGLEILKSPLLLPSGATTYIAGRTGRGKTATLINIAVNSLIKEIGNERPIVFFSYEENSRNILMKFLNTYINKKFSENNRHCIRDYYSQRDARFVDLGMRNDFIRLEQNFFNFCIDTGKLIIVDSQSHSDELINQIYYLHKNKNIRAVLIDYIQRIGLKESKKANRHEELKIICNSLVDCAIKTGLPIISGSQFNRQATEDRGTLTLTNLGEAGDIERSANMVIAVDIKRNVEPNKPSEFYIKILKNRDGVSEISDDSLTYDGNTGKIKNNSLGGF